MIVRSKELKEAGWQFIGRVRGIETSDQKLRASNSKRIENRSTMSHQRRIYGREGEDSWWLGRDDAGQIFVLQERRSKEMGRWKIEAFLREESQGPQHEALINLIGELTVFRD